MSEQRWAKILFEEKVKDKNCASFYCCSPWKGKGLNLKASEETKGMQRESKELWTKKKNSN